MNNEFLKMQKLAGLITEGEFKANLNEMSEETLVSTLEENGFEVVPNPAWIVRNSETGDDYILYTESGDYISHKLVGTFPEGVKIMGEGADDWLEQFLETEKKTELNEVDKFLKMQKLASLASATDYKQKPNNEYNLQPIKSILSSNVSPEEKMEKIGTYLTDTEEGQYLSNTNLGNPVDAWFDTNENAIKWLKQIERLINSPEKIKDISDELY